MGSNRGYKDVTKEWLSSIKSSKCRVLKRNYYMHDGIKYYVDVKLVVLNYSQDELETAKLIRKTFGGNVYVNPRINYPKGIKTADYLWCDELWDKKGMKDATSNIRAVHNAIKNCRNQASNFIIDISGCVLSNQVIIKQVYNLFTSSSKFYLGWLKK